MMALTPNADLISIIESSRHVLIDFDGPICKIFAVLPAESVAADLRELLTGAGIGVPPELQQETDPLEVLRFAGNVGRKVADRVESALRNEELEAVRTAMPTPGSSDLIIGCRRTGRSVGIVSNNSGAAVEKYLKAQDISQHVDHVAARTRSDPNWLKPHPHLIFQSMRALDANPESTVLVGDSVSDIEAAQAAGISHIGFANKPGKLQRLKEADADAVVTNLAELTSVVLASTALRPR